MNSSDSANPQFRKEYIRPVCSPKSKNPSRHESPKTEGKSKAYRIQLTEIVFALYFSSFPKEKMKLPDFRAVASLQNQLNTGLFEELYIESKVLLCVVLMESIAAPVVVFPFIKPSYITFVIKSVLSAMVPYPISGVDA